MNFENVVIGDFLRCIRNDTDRFTEGNKYKVIMINDVGVSCGIFTVIDDRNRLQRIYVSNSSVFFRFLTE